MMSNEIRPIRDELKYHKKDSVLPVVYFTENVICSEMNLKLFDIILFEMQIYPSFIHSSYIAYRY